MGLDRFNQGVESAVGGLFSGIGAFFRFIGKLLLGIVCLASLAAGIGFSLWSSVYAAREEGWQGIWITTLGAVTSPLWFFLPLAILLDLFTITKIKVSRFRYVFILVYFIACIAIYAYNV